MTECWLPNSGTQFWFGLGLSFCGTIKPVDGIGYEPDVWCNGKTALDSVLNMIIRYGLAEQSAVNALRQQLK